MDKLVIGVILGLGAIALIAALSLVSGTIVWLLWPYAMAAFPGLVKAGTRHNAGCKEPATVRSVV